MTPTNLERKWMGIYFHQGILNTNRDNLFTIENKYRVLTIWLKDYLVFMANVYLGLLLRLMKVAFISWWFPDFILCPGKSN